MAVDVNIHITLEGSVNVDNLHVHIPVLHDVALNVKVDSIMAGMAELTAKVAEVSAAVQTTLTNTTEIVKDVQRLLAQDTPDTQGAIDALSTTEAALTTANESLLALDAAVEAISPEPAAPVEPAPVEPGTPSDDNPLGL